jgi:hypothetical protein
VRTVLEHLEEREGGDVDLLGGVEQRRVRRRLAHPGGAEDPLQPLHGPLPLRFEFDLVASRVRRAGAACSGWNGLGSGCGLPQFSFF